MQKDCHYYGTFLMACLAGFSQAEAEVIAWASQTVSELDTEKLAELKSKRVDIPFFVTSISPEEFAYGTTHNLRGSEVKTLFRGILLPFHYLPGNFRGALAKEKIFSYEGPEAIAPILYNSYAPIQKRKDKAVNLMSPLHAYSFAGSRGEEDMKLICRTCSSLAREVIEYAKAQYKAYVETDKIKALCAVGIALHALADTWAHENFAGTPSYWVNNSTIKVDECNYYFLWKSDRPYNNYANYTIAFSDNWNVNGPEYTGSYTVNGITENPGIKFSVKHSYGLKKSYDNTERFFSAFVQVYDALDYIHNNKQDLQLREKIATPVSSAAGKCAEVLLELKEEVLSYPVTEERLRRWLQLISRVILEETSAEVLPKYQFEQYSLAAFVQMALAHRDNVLCFLRKNTVLYIDIRTTDKITKKLTDARIRATTVDATIASTNDKPNQSNGMSEELYIGKLVRGYAHSLAQIDNLYNKNTSNYYESLESSGAHRELHVNYGNYLSAMIVVNPFLSDEIKGDEEKHRRRALHHLQRLVTETNTSNKGNVAEDGSLQLLVPVFIQEKGLREKIFPKPYGSEAVQKDSLLPFLIEYAENGKNNPEGAILVPKTSIAEGKKKLENCEGIKIRDQCNIFVGEALFAVLLWVHVYLSRKVKFNFLPVEEYIHSCYAVHYALRKCGIISGHQRYENVTPFCEGLLRADRAKAKSFSNFEEIWKTFAYDLDKNIYIAFFQREENYRSVRYNHMELVTNITRNNKGHIKKVETLGAHPVGANVKTYYFSEEKMRNDTFKGMTIVELSRAALENILQWVPAE